MDGSGWITEIALVNPGNTTLSGSVEFHAQSGQSASVGIGGQVNSSFSYSIPAKSSKKLQTSGTSNETIAGWVRIVPSSNAASPSRSVNLFPDRRRSDELRGRRSTGCSRYRISHVWGDGGRF